EYAAVLALLDSQLEVITGDGKYFRQRLEQLAQRPAKLVEAETARDRVLDESRRASARAGELRAQVEEGERARAQLTVARGRAGRGATTPRDTTPCGPSSPSSSRSPWRRRRSRSGRAAPRAWCRKRNGPSSSCRPGSGGCAS